jgi:hypothetical protein
LLLGYFKIALKTHHITKVKFKILKGDNIMKKLDMIKGATGLVVSIGVGAIVSNVIKTTTPINANKIMKVCIGMGSIVLGSMATDQATKYTEQKIDDAAESIKGMVTNGDLN